MRTHDQLGGKKSFRVFLLIGLLIVSGIFLYDDHASAKETSNLLLTIPPILSAHSSGALPPATPPAGGSLALKIYVAGESVEEFNHFNILPFNADGSLHDRGTDNNTQNEYGWMVPFAERLKKRDSNIDISWIGEGCWQNQDTWECSTGTLTNANIGKSSAQAGSTIADWNDGHRSELTGKQFCYNIAFASRGGNDLNNGVSVDTYRNQLRNLILDLDQGSNCRTHPVIYITAHLLDIAGWNYGYQQADIDEWMNTQKAYYVTVAQQLATELNGQNGMAVRFIDMWTPFHEDLATTAFPSETWWTTHSGTGVQIPDLEKIHREGFANGQHPRRLASIFAGENVADQINIQDLRTILGQ